MTQIDFYILSDNSPHSGELFACKLVDKAYHLQHTVYINTPGKPQAEHLDDLLWTFSAGSFLPHALNSQSLDSQSFDSQEPNSQEQSLKSPILIGHTNQSTTFHDVLINLTQDVPAFFSQFERVAEIVYGDETMRNASRIRYKFYRDRGYMLKTHNLGP